MDSSTGAGIQRQYWKPDQDLLTNLLNRMVKKTTKEMRRPQDDPATLDPEEDRQCQAWWNQIIGATTQETWRKTRSMYEAACRKPLLRMQF